MPLLSQPVTLLTMLCPHLTRILSIPRSAFRRRHAFLPEVSLLPLLLVLFALGTTSCSKEAKRQSYLESADRHFAEGAYDKAEIEYLNALRQTSTPDAHILTRLGTISYEQGEILQAFAFLARAQQLATTNIEVQTKMALLYAATRNFSNAQAEAIAVLSKQPTNEDALLVLADTSVTREAVTRTQQRLEQLRPQAGQTAAFHLALGSLKLRQQDQAGAIAAYNQAYAIAPKSSAVNAALGRYHFRQGDTNKADAAFKAAAENAPARSSRKLLYVDFKLQTGAVDEGKRLLETLTKDTPDYLPAQLLKARIAFAEKRLDDAQALVTQIINRDAINLDAQMLRGQISLAKGDFAKGVEQFEQLLTQFRLAGDQTIAQIQYELALALLLSRDLPRAISTLEQVIRHDPGLVRAQLLLGQLHLRAGRAAEVITAMRPLVNRTNAIPQAVGLMAEAHAVLGQLNEAVANYQKLSALLPREIEPLLAQASLQLRLKRTNDAVALYRRIREIEPRDARPYYLEGVTLLNQGNLAAARLSFEQALKTATNYLAALSQLIGIDVREKKFDAAQARAQQWIQTYPKESEPWILLSRVYQSQGSTNKAEEALMKAIEAEPDQMNAYSILANFYLASGKTDEALARYEQMVSKSPSNIVALAQVGMLYSQQKRYDKARSAFENLLKVNPNSPLALNNLAYLYSEQLVDLERAYALGSRAYDVAVQAAEAAARSSSGTGVVAEANRFKAVASDTFGWILYKRGDYERALALITESAQQLAQNPEVLYHLGMARYSTGDEAGAREALQKAAASSEDFPGRTDAPKRLALLNLDPSKADMPMISLLEKAVADDPKDFLAHLKLATARERLGQADRAGQSYEAASRIHPRYAPALAGLARSQAANPATKSKAVETARRARELAPQDPSIAYALGRLAFDVAEKAEDFTWAHSLLVEAARGYPKNGVVLYDQGRSAYALGLIAEATNAWRQALTVEPGFAQAASARTYLEIVGLSLNPQAAQQASARLQEALKLDPNHVPALMAAGLVYESRGQLKDALQVYERALARFPAFGPALARLAMTYAESGSDDAKAYTLAQRARDLYPADPDVAKALGKLSYRRNDLAYATRLLQESSRSRPKDADLLYHLGLAQSKQRLTNEAKVTITAALNLDPNHILAAEAKSALSQSTLQR